MGSLGASELLILPIFVGVTVAAVRLLVRSGGAAVQQRHHSALVSDATPEAFIQRAAAAAASLPKHTLSGVGGATLIVTRNYLKPWRIVVAILLFPIGLIALMARDQETATITAAFDGGRTRVTLDGFFTGQLIDRVNSVIN